MKSTFLLGAIALFLASGCAESAGAASPPAATDAGAPKTIKTVTFNPKALEQLGIKVEPTGNTSANQRLHVPGSIDYGLEKYAEVGTLVEGRVKGLFALPGEKVTKGKVLATLVVPSAASAQADYQSAMAAAKAAEENERREESLIAKQLTTAREVEVARSEARRAKSDLAAASAKLQLLGVGTEIVQGAGTVTLYSPIDGVVVRRNAILGRHLAPNESAFVIADPSELRATLDVYEADLPFFHVGSELEMTVDALPGTVLKGKIALIEPHLGKASRALRAIVPLPNPDGTLRPGLFLRASVPISQATAGSARLFIAAGAVQPLGEDDVVFVEHEAGSFEVRKVAVGRRTAQIVEIVQGLSTGERIVVDGAFLLRAEVTKQ